MKTIFVRLVAWILRRKDLDTEQRGVLINSAIEALNALPLREIIQRTPDGILLVNGKAVDREEAAKLRESAKRDLQSRTLALVRDQVLFTAMHFSVTQTTNFDQVYAGKMAVWWGQEEQRHLRVLAEERPEIE